jgi:hypothetical protein
LPCIWFSRGRIRGWTKLKLLDTWLKKDARHMLVMLRFILPTPLLDADSEELMLEQQLASTLESDIEDEGK